MGSTHAELFRKRWFPDAVIMTCVRWYTRYSLSLRDVRDLIAERDAVIDHSTIWRWLQRYAPVFRKRLQCKVRCTGACWRVDETYVRVAGEWTYLYRAMDADGQTIYFLLSRPRDGEAARHFFRQAIADVRHIASKEIVTDGNPTYPAIIKQLKHAHIIASRCRFRCSRALNNRVEQDHRG